MAVMGVIIILSVQALVSLAILIYFERHHRDEVHWWKTRLAPVLALLSQAFVVYLLFDNITFLGSGYGYANWFGPIDLAVVLGGVGAAFYFKKRKPEKYESGRAPDQRRALITALIHQETEPWRRPPPGGRRFAPSRPGRVGAYARGSGVARGFGVAEHAGYRAGRVAPGRAVRGDRPGAGCRGC